MLEVSLWGRTVARFDQGAQQIGKKFTAFGLCDPGQDFEHLFEIIAVRQSVLASPGMMTSSSDMTGCCPYRDCGVSLSCHSLWAVS
jgi:hypothetical protein